MFKLHLQFAFKKFCAKPRIILKTANITNIAINAKTAIITNMAIHVIFHMMEVQEDNKQREVVQNSVKPD